MLFSQMALGKIAATFVKRYPRVQLETTTEDRAVDMVDEGYDLVMRVNPDPDAGLVGRVLVRDPLIAAAHPGLPMPVAGAAAPAVFRPSGDGGHWELVTPQGDLRLAIAPALRLGSLTMVRDAVRAGTGVALLPLSLVAADLDSGRLVSWGDAKAPPIEIWALYPSRRLLSSRVAAVLDLLKEAFPLGHARELARYAMGDLPG